MNGANISQEAGRTLEVLDSCMVERYPSDLDDLDYCALLERYERSKDDLIALCGVDSIRIANALRDYLEVRDALREALAALWPEQGNDPSCKLP
ncbi:MAG: hypothetical protein P4L33_18590 [Capsulimonadaceae bacterium]|nr:hypothetical protein [Capsulimonadaceae bacterium]